MGISIALIMGCILGVHGTWVSGGADDKENMLSESDKSSGLYNCTGVTGYGVAGVDPIY